MADIEYKTNGFYYRIMLPEAEPCIDAFRKIAEVYPDAEVPASAWQSVKSQLKAAGYSVAKYRERKMSEKEKADILDALDLGSLFSK